MQSADTISTSGAAAHLAGGVRAAVAEQARAAMQSGVEEVAAFLQEGDIARLAKELAAFARRKPTLFIGGAFMLGWLTARLLRGAPKGAGAERDEADAASDHQEAGARSHSTGPSVGAGQDDATLEEQVTAPQGYGPAPGGYGPASSPAGAFGGQGTFGADGAGGGPGNQVNG